MEWGFWTLTIVLVVAGFFLCFVEGGAQSWGGSPRFPKLNNILIKTFFLPHQYLYYACVQWQAVKSHSVR